MRCCLLLGLLALLAPTIAVQVTIADLPPLLPADQILVVVGTSEFDREDVGCTCTSQPTLDSFAPLWWPDPAPTTWSQPLDGWDVPPPACSQPLLADFDTSHLRIDYPSSALLRDCGHRGVVQLTATTLAFPLTILAWNATRGTAQIVWSRDVVVPYAAPQAIEIERTPASLLCGLLLPVSAAIVSVPSWTVPMVSNWVRLRLEWPQSSEVGPPREYSSVTGWRLAFSSSLLRNVYSADGHTWDLDLWWPSPTTALEFTLPMLWNCSSNHICTSTPDTCLPIECSERYTLRANPSLLANASQDALHVLPCSLTPLNGTLARTWTRQTTRMALALSTALGTLLFSSCMCTCYAAKRRRRKRS